MNLMGVKEEERALQDERSPRPVHGHVPAVGVNEAAVNAVKTRVVLPSAVIMIMATVPSSRLRDLLLGNRSILFLFVIPGAWAMFCGGFVGS